MRCCSGRWGYWWPGGGARQEEVSCLPDAQQGRRAAAYLYDFGLSMLGPEGLGRGGAADRNKAGWLTIQSGSDQLAAGYRSRYTDYKRLGTNGL